MLEKLKTLRAKNGVTQRQLAEAIGVSQQSINKYENQNIEPDISTLIAMAEYFNTTVDYLVGRTELSDEPVYSLNLTGEEINLVNNYRTLSPKEKESINLILENYNK